MTECEKAKRYTLDTYLCVYELIQQQEQEDCEHILSWCERLYG